jgi:hypothetical protein
MGAELPGQDGCPDGSPNLEKASIRSKETGMRQRVKTTMFLKFTVLVRIFL